MDGAVDGGWRPPGIADGGQGRVMLAYKEQVDTVKRGLQQLVKPWRIRILEDSAKTTSVVVKPLREL